jgi:hypothetical protein
VTAADPLTPIRRAMSAMAAQPGVPPLHGLAGGLTVPDESGWTPATALVRGDQPSDRLSDMLATAARRWAAAPHVAAALAWKHYTYWLCLPALLGYAAARRVPLLRPAGVLARWSDGEPFLRIGLARVPVAVLDTDPLAGRPDLVVVTTETELLERLRESLVDDHLEPLLVQIHERVRLGRRTLLGSLASGVAHAFSRAAGVLPGSAMDHADRVLRVLGVADLVELAPAEHGRLHVQRHTCCLAFALPTPRLCAGCCIGSAATT